MEFVRAEVARISLDLTSLRNHAQALVVFSMAVLGAALPMWVSLETSAPQTRVAVLGVVVVSIVFYSRAHLLYRMIVYRYAYLDALNDYSNKITGCSLFLDPEIKRLESARIPNNINMLVIPLLQILIATIVVNDITSSHFLIAVILAVLAGLLVIALYLLWNITSSLVSTRRRFLSKRDDFQSWIGRDLED